MFIDYASKPPIPAFDKPVPHLSNYDRVYEASKSVSTRKEPTLAEYLATYERAGARHVVVKAKDVETTFGVRTTNEEVAAFCEAQGGRYIGFAGVDPHKGMTAIREVPARPGSPPAGAGKSRPCPPSLRGPGACTRRPGPGAGSR